MDEREAALVVMSARGVGPARARELKRAFGSYAAVVEAAALSDQRVPPAASGAMRDALRRVDAKEEIRSAGRAGARFVIETDEEYPQVLAATTNAPVGVFVAGVDLSELQPALAVVGTRTPTERGMATARDLAGDAAEAGLTVVSGLARGIDTAAHEAALEAGGTTVAVFGTGLLCVYPGENADLARRISEGGALVSEFPLRQGPRPGSFPARNRVVAGLAAGVLVVEGGERSGALITAARALDEGREVFAVPGPITEPQSKAPNALIKSGAVLVESVDDVLSELARAWGPFRALKATGGGADRSPDGNENRSGRDTLAARVEALLSMEPLSVDDLAAAVGAGAGELASVLLALELAGVARSVPGGRYVATRSASAARRRRGRADGA